MNLRGEATAKRMIIFLLIRYFPWIRSHFFNKANELMVKNSPAAADKEMLEKIAAVNIGPWYGI